MEVCSYKNEAWIHPRKNSFYVTFLKDLEIIHISANYIFVKYLSIIYTPPDPSTKLIFFFYWEQKVDSTLSDRSV